MKNILNLPEYEQEGFAMKRPASKDMKGIGEFYDDVVQNLQQPDRFYVLEDLWYIEEWTEGDFNSKTGKWKGEKDPEDVVSRVATSISEASTLVEGGVDLDATNLYYCPKGKCIVIDLMDQHLFIMDFLAENGVDWDVDFSGMDIRFEDARSE